METITSPVAAMKAASGFEGAARDMVAPAVLAGYITAPEAERLVTFYTNLQPDGTNHLALLKQSLRVRQWKAARARKETKA